MAWPLFYEGGEWSIPDIVWEYVWARLIATGRLEKVFYAGHIRTLKEFIAFMRSNGIAPVLVVDKGNSIPIMLAWASLYDTGVMHAHFVFLSGLPYPEAGGVPIDYWYSRIKGLRVLIGVIAEHNVTAWKFAMRVGFKKLGVVPDMLDMFYEGKRVPAMILYYTHKRGLP